MEKFTLNKRLLSVLVLIIATLALLVYARMESISVAHNENETLTEVNLNKYVNYDEAWGKGTILQYDVKTGIEYGEDKEQSPIKNTTLMAVAPQINGVYPDRATVVSKSTKSTNGKEVNSEINYSYDATVGTVTVQASNENQDGTAINGTTDQNARDEYVVIFNYGEAAYDGTNSSKEIDMQLSVIQNLFADENNVAQSSDTFKSTVSENIGGFATVDETSSDIYNGNIKSNAINETDYATTFTENDEISIANKDAQDKLTTTITPTFVREYQDRNGETKQQDLGNNGGVVYKSTKVQKDDIQNVLGADGELYIQDTAGNTLATINKDTQYADDGTYTIIYETELQSLVVKTSNIVNEGEIRLESTKEIKSSMKNTDNIKIKVASQIVGTKTETVASSAAATEAAKETGTTETEVQSYSTNGESQIEIKQAQTNVSLDLNNTEWTNEKQNDTEFDITLNSNSEKDNMFKNPTVKIELPNEVEKIVLGDSSILYANGLELTGVTTETNEAGNFVIDATMSGAQTTYNSNELGLQTTIKIPATIILKNNIETKAENININYTNEYTISGTVEAGNITKEIKVNNYQENIAAEEQEQQKQDEVYAEAEQNQNEAAVTVNEELNNSLKLEVAPVKGDTVLKDGDTIYEGEFIKYNVKVTNTTDKDINNVNILGSIPDGTTYGEQTTNYTYSRGNIYNFDENLKQKRIDVGTIKAGESYNTFYEVKVNNLADGEEQKEITSDIKASIGNDTAQNYTQTNTVQKADVQVYLTANCGPSVDQWTFFLSLEGSNTDQDVDVTYKMPSDFKFDYLVEDNGTDRVNVNVSDNNEMTATLKVGKLYALGGFIDRNTILEKYGKDIELDAIAYAKVGDKTYTSNEDRAIYKVDNIEISVESDNEGEKVTEGDEINYTIKVKNTGGVNLEKPDNISTNVNVRDFLPENVKPVSMTYENYRLETESQTRNNVETFEYTGNYTKYTETEDLSTIQKDSDGNKLPNVNLDMVIPYGETAEIKVNTVAKAVEKETTIENSGTVDGDTVIAKTSNIVTHTIVPPTVEGQETQGEENNQSQEQEEQNNNEQTNNNQSNSEQSNANSQNTKSGNNTISGIAWLDENLDGQRQSDEKTLSGIDVLLISMDNSSHIQAQTKTANDGKYNFANLSQGDYIVAFKYDTNKYKLTEYQKAGIGETLNSDAISKSITLDGSQQTLAVTDTISGLASNVDAGFVENKPCDLKVDKYVSKITVKTNKGTKNYTYNKQDTAKVEIRAKEIEGATVVINYKFVITNVGETAGKVGKIVDTLPQGLSFSSDLNSSWAKGTNGTLTNQSLSNQMIAAGESKEITLVATKQMTADSTGLYTNNVELQEISSSENGDDANADNNKSKADVILSVSTGAVVYISLALGILAAIGIGIYAVKRAGFSKKDTKKKLGKIGKIGLFGIALVLVMVTGLNTVDAKVGETRYWTHDGVWRDGHWAFTDGDGSQDGDCALHGWAAYEGATYTLDHYMDTSWKTTYQSEDSSKFKYSGNTDTQAHLQRLDDTYYMFGPLKITDSANVKNNFKAVSNKGKTVPSTVCDKDGNELKGNDLKGEGTYYIKVKKTDCRNGIHIDSEATKEGKIITEQEQLGKGYWVTDSSHQTIKQHYVEPTGETRRLETDTETTHDLSWTAEGAVEIQKVDMDDNGVVLDKVTLTLNGSQVTDTSGWAFWIVPTPEDPKKSATYTLSEILNAHYGYTKLPASKTYSVSSGQVITDTYENEKQTGNLLIKKTDADRDPTKPLAGFKFKLKSGNGYVAVSSTDYIHGDGWNPEKEVTGEYLVGSSQDGKSEEEGTTFVTDANGVIKIVNLLKGNYTLEEVEASENYYGYTITADKQLVDPEYIEWNVGQETTSGRQNLADTKEMSVTVNRRPSTKTKSTAAATEYDQLNVYDKKKFIKLTGNVWEDLANLQKNEEGDDLLNGDTPIQGMKVTLKNQDGTDVQVASIDSQIAGDEAAKSTFKNPTYTAEDGSYYFDDVLIGTGVSDKIHNRTVNGARCYYIEFEYDGEVYTCVRSFEDLGISNTDAGKDTSKAAEVEEQRDGVDNSYKEVTGKGDGTEYIDYSNIIGEKGDFNEHYTLTSGSSENEASAKSKNKELFDSQGGSSRNVAQFSGYENYNTPEINKLTATTKETKYGVLGAFNEDGTPSTALREDKVANGVETPDSIRKNDIEELAQRNYGTKEREKVNLAVSNDVDNVEVTINGYKNNYKYAKSKASTDQENYANVLPGGDDEDMYQYKNFRLDVKLRNKFGYVRPLYRSDIEYDGETRNNKCEIYVVYKMTIANISNSITAEVTHLSNYYDSRYTIVGTKLVDEASDNAGIFENNKEISKTQIPGTENTTNGKTVSYSVSDITDLAGTKIEAGQSKVLYVKYKVDPEAVMSVLESDVQMSNVIEINGFTSYYSDKTYYHNGVGSRSGKLYAGIDRNSAPGNAKIEYDGNKLNTVRTYEDDTSNAPTVTLTLTEGERIITGTVFEDSTTTGDGKTTSSKLQKDSDDGYTSKDSVDTGSERIGDGIYEAGKDDTVGKVKVELLYWGDSNGTKKHLSNAVLYSYQPTSGNAYGRVATDTGLEENMQYTDENGTYKFEGIVPDKYILKFTYADGNVVYKNGAVDETEFEGGKITADYYKSTIVTSNIVRDALNNNEIVGNGQQQTLDGTAEPYDSKKWQVLSEDNFADGTEYANGKTSSESTNYKAYINQDEKGSVVRYSDATDTNDIVNKSIDNTYKINNDAYADANDAKKYTGEKSKDGSHYTAKEAYTGIMNVQLELDVNEADGDDQNTTTETTEGPITVRSDDGSVEKIIDKYIRSSCDNVDFGIVQRARHAYDLNKEVANIKITLAGGEVLLDGDPSKDTVQYVKYLPEYGKRFTRINMEIDNELLVGATMEITYRIVATNLSETNYVTTDYYRYGQGKSDDKIETITLSKIFDYLDDKLTFNREVTENDDNRKIVDKKDNTTNRGYIEVQTGDNKTYTDVNESNARIFVIGKIDENNNILNIKGTSEDAKLYISDREITDANGEKTTPLNETKKYEVMLLVEGKKNLKPAIIDRSGTITNADDSAEIWNYVVTDTLAPSDDLDYFNDIETTEITTTNTPSWFKWPGNYNPKYSHEKEQKGDVQEDNFKSEVVINSPTGENRSYTVYIVGTIALVVLGAGIIIIKRKAL